ncbi:MAG: CotH kinase family protein [Clostridia bacterium]|nr:CotH kinase family protein [Clostridia bacterium]
MKKIRFLLCLFVFCLLFSVQIFAAESFSVIQILPDGETVAVSHTQGIFYLPSSVDIRNVSLDFEGTLAYTVNGETKTLSKGETLDLTSAKTVDARGAVCYIFTFSHNGKNEIFTFYHGENLPSVFVATSKGISDIDSDKNNRDKEAKIVMLSADGNVEYNDRTGDTKSEIKARGNATFTYLKKPYQIKLGEKTAIFGMEKAKTWILLANYTDQTAIHNALAFELGNALDIPYNIDYRFVNLYIDGEYRGLYMITEKVQVDNNRVDITDLEKANENANEGKAGDEFSIAKQTGGEVVERSILSYYTYASGMKSPEDITGGYIVELDTNRGLSEPCHFVTENGNVYTVKAPEYASREEMEYIAELFADMEEAIFSADGYNQKGVHYSEYIDMESFAGIYTAQELLKNWDAYLSSMFFFKDADQDGERAKIYMGSLWDMDNTLGNINFNYEFGQDTAYLWAQNGVFQDLKRDFAKNLMCHEDFQKVVENTYAKAYLAVTDYLSEGGWLEKTVDMLLPSVTMDRTRWKLYDADSWLLNQAGRKSSVKFVQFKEYGTAHDETKDTALGFMRYYLTSRMDALLHLIGSGEVPTPPEITETSGTSDTIQTTETQLSEHTSTSGTETVNTTEQTETSESLEEPMDCGGIFSVVYIFVTVLVLIAAVVIVILIFVIKKKK